MSSEGNAVVRIFRRRPVIRDRFAKYYVNIDGNRVGVAKSGQSCDFRIPPGTHEIIIESRSGGARSNALTVVLQSGSERTLECRANGSILTTVSDSFASLGSGRPWIMLSERTVMGE
jgi:hypothetical protein